jgi:hypothetical protein
MADGKDNRMDKHGTVKWIIALCVTAVIAVSGWTLTGTLAARSRSDIAVETTREKAYEDVRRDVTSVSANVSANNIRISVLENKYDTIDAALSEIKALLMTHMRDTR